MRKADPSMSRVVVIGLNEMQVTHNLTAIFVI
jgi:hypothetical protein